jgi:hypothetical protein
MIDQRRVCKIAHLRRYNLGTRQGDFAHTVGLPDSV